MNAVTGDEKDSSNIINDRLSAEQVRSLNSQLMNTSSIKLKKATEQVGGGFGGLFGHLVAASKNIAPAAALFLASTIVNKKKDSRSVKRKTRKNRK